MSPRTSTPVNLAQDGYHSPNRRRQAKEKAPAALCYRGLLESFRALPPDVRDY